MELLPLDKLGARQSAPGVFDFGVFLPWIAAANGNRVFVKLIHEQDQFLKNVPSESFELAHSVDAKYGDYWSGQAVLASRAPPTATSAWGAAGTYVYRLEIHNPDAGTLDFIADPFAREYGTGKLSAITLDYQPHVWAASEQAWKTPNLRDLVIYELMLDEFADGVDGTIARLDYLTDLGVNCLEIMPVSNVSLTVDWGFLPIGYFGVDERFGNRADLQRLVEAAHQRGIAVILDAVYGHTAGDFPYGELYRRLRYRENPFLGAFAKDLFGESTDFKRKFVQDFFYTVNHHWLAAYHVDGFRYDCVPNYWDGPLGVGYSNLVYNTYKEVRDRGAVDHWQRFFDGGVNLIQCAEQLEAPAGVLRESLTNCTWQNETRNAAVDVAHAAPGALTNLGFRLGLDGMPAETDHGDGIVIRKSALQYIENHDHERFVNHFGQVALGEDLFREGDRSQWYKVQPYLIGLLCAQGIPMLWQGQELAENYWVPDGGMARVMLFRPVRWDYFYDDVGRATISLVRRLIALRHARRELRRGNYYFYNDDNRYQFRGLLLFSREDAGRFTLVALNFSGSDQSVPFWFPIAGDYREQLHDRAEDALPGVPPWGLRNITVPGNYGRIWSNQ